MIQAVIFDLDELIIDLEHIHKAAESQICREHGYEFVELPKDLRYNTSGLRENDVLVSIKDYLKLSTPITKLIERKQEIFRELMAKEELKPMPGAVKTVKEIAESRKYPLALTSSGARSRIELVLKRLEILELFDVIVTGEDVERGKPDPEPYRVTARRLGIQPDEGIVFEDADVGVQSAKSAGLWCIGVRNPAARTRQTLNDADVILPDLTHFSFSLFEQLNRSK